MSLGSSRCRRRNLATASPLAFMYVCGFASSDALGSELAVPSSALVPFPADRHAPAFGERVHDHESEVVSRQSVARAGIAETDDQLHGVAERSADPRADHEPLPDSFVSLVSAAAGAAAPSAAASSVAATFTSSTVGGSTVTTASLLSNTAVTFGGI